MPAAAARGADDPHLGKISLGLFNPPNPPGMKKKSRGGLLPSTPQPSPAPTFLRRRFPPAVAVVCAAEEAAAHAQCRLSCGAGRAARAQLAGQSPHASSPHGWTKPWCRRAPQKGRQPRGLKPQGGFSHHPWVLGLNIEIRAAAAGMEVMK